MKLGSNGLRGALIVDEIPIRGGGLQGVWLRQICLGVSRSNLDRCFFSIVIEVDVS